MRQIVLDTETTGLEPEQGHRVIEIGGVELVDRKRTGTQFHKYINPQREIDAQAIEVHGITREFLEDKPTFEEICDELVEFLRDAELIIHNAPFDTAFLDHEFKRISGARYRVHDLCKVKDSLALARRKRPGRQNDLNSLCRDYQVDNAARTLHGALLDADLLADVYLAMTGGQTGMFGDPQGQEMQAVMDQDEFPPLSANRRRLKVIRASAEELAAHERMLQRLGDACVWTNLQAGQ